MNPQGDEVVFTKPFTLYLLREIGINMQYDTYHHPQRYDHEPSYSYGGDYTRHDPPNTAYSNNFSTDSHHQTTNNNVVRQSPLPVVDLPLYELPPAFISRTEVGFTHTH